MPRSSARPGFCGCGAAKSSPRTNSTRTPRVSGSMRLDDFRREYPALGDVPQVETMGGLLMGLLDVVPSQGEFAIFRGLKLTAHSAGERRVREVLVEAVK
jgi:CBS domain containing-hemolysin-like protein